MCEICEALGFELNNTEKIEALVHYCERIAVIAEVYRLSARLAPTGSLRERVAIEGWERCDKLIQEGEAEIAKLAN